MRRREFIALVVARLSHGRSLRGRRRRGGPIASVSCLPFRAMRRLLLRFWTNCDAAASLKAKTSRSIIAIMGHTLI